MGWWDDLKAYFAGTRATPPADDPQDDLPPLPDDRGRVLEIVLADEIADDVAGLGYAGKSPAEIAALLNDIRNEVTIDRDVVNAYEVIEATVAAEWAALSATEKDRYRTIVAAGKINVKGANTRAAFAAMFGSGTTTRTNLVALQTRKGSRAESLFGVGRVITEQEIRTALREGEQSAYLTRQAAIETRTDELVMEHPEWSRRQAREVAAQETP